MPVRTPTLEQIKSIGSDFGLVFTDDETSAFQTAFKGSLASYARLEELVEPVLAPISPRSPGYRPSAGENPFGGWYWKTDIHTEATGLLSGKKVAIKDNIAVAGVPMMNGSALLEGYIPEFDASVVTRILAAGGTIAGKAACEDLCFCGASHTCAGGTIRNPHNPAHSAGGSSGGSAALIAAGEVPMALGGDQGGSIRTPSSWCGVYGLKPTWGLVPTTGSMPISYSIDHCGPMGASVDDVARLLTVIAGHDGWDTRTISARTGDYMGALSTPAKGLRIGILREGFGHPESDPQVDAKVRAAIESLVKAGIEAEEVSVPWHLDGPHVWTGIILEGATEMMLKGYGFGNNVQGYYPVSMQEAFARGMGTRINDVSPTVKMVLMLGEYMHRHYHGRYHSKAQNPRVFLRQAYDAALEKYDALAMPTIPFTATPIPPADAPLETLLVLALNMQANTCPFDVSGHPAFTIPCGRVNDLPVGLMFVGRHFEETTLIQLASAVEAGGDWKTN
ncbi:amidase [Aminobacter sp. MSH1]|uniref:amidase n=1 Tax=Aminobacter sp. MSH1 TaxID=374606 RepID=UPI000D33F6EC|nr:amidase [Aminobacter sp. MSH1]